MSRVAVFLSLIAGLLATPPGPALAATQSFDFSFKLFEGTADDFLSSPFPQFDPTLGNLTGAFETVSGSAIWFPGGPDAELSLTIGPIGARQTFDSSSGNVQSIDVNLSGDRIISGIIGTGSIEENLVSRELPEGHFVDGTVPGKITYTYTPAVLGGSPPAVPELSTWAMMLLGFAGLGRTVVRRKGAVPGGRPVASVGAAQRALAPIRPSSAS